MELSDGVLTDKLGFDILATRKNFVPVSRLEKR